MTKRKNSSQNNNLHDDYYNEFRNGVLQGINK